MADKDEHTHKRYYHASRGRGGQNRVYPHLGVRDLREIIDRKRSEREHIGDTVIPHDPSYNYLKDPSRENVDDCVQEPHKQVNTRKHNKNYPNNNFKKDKDSYGAHASHQPRNKDIENPLNIQVEFSTSTGEHIYKLDESKVLPTIKHIPDRLPPQNRWFRGRGRGRGRGQQSYQTRTIRNKRNSTENVPSSQQSNPDETPVAVASEENWDSELNEKKEVSDLGEGFEQGDAEECGEVDEIYEDLGHVDEGENFEQTTEKESGEVDAIYKDQGHVDEGENFEQKTEEDSLEKRVESLRLDQGETSPHDDKQDVKTQVTDESKHECKD
jgi:hypothetical protein